MAKEIFISYSRKDFDKVKAIKDEIDRELGIKCWMDLDGIESGEEFETKIIDAINSHRFFLFMLSPNSMASEYALDELNFAHTKGKHIDFVNVTKCQMTDRFLFKYKKYDAIDWSDPLQHDKLLNNFRKRLSNKPTQTSISETYSVRFSIDETCELYIDGEKKRKLKGGHQSIVEGFETKKKYRISFHSLARTNSVIDTDYIQSSLAVPNQVFDMNISFVEQRQKEEEEAISKRKVAKQEKEREREREGFLQQALSIYDEHDESSEGFIRVRKNGLYGFVNEDGFEVIPCIYNKASYFFGSYTTVCQNSKWGLLDQYGQIVMDLGSDCPCWQISDGKYIVAGRQGKFAITTIEKGIPDSYPYNEVAFVADYEDVFWVRDDKGWRLISMSDRDIPFTIVVGNIKTYCMTLDYRRYYDSHYFNSSKHLGEGIRVAFLPVCVQNAFTHRWGIINTRLKLSIPFVDEMADDTIDDNLKIIQTNQKQGIADVEKGVFLVPCIHERIDRVTFDGYLEPFYKVMNDLSVIDNWAPSCLGGRQGMVDLGGNIVVPMSYQCIWLRGDENRDLDKFVCLLAPDLRNGRDSKGNGPLFIFNPDKAAVHVYDTKGNLIEKGPYRQNKYYDWYLD